jgi:NADP-dependent 3-hydroxy acid dehydrogenase YdfG
MVRRLNLQAWEGGMFEGKTTLVTGTSSGIGRATALALAADLTAEEDCLRVVNDTVRAFGGHRSGM